MDFTVTAIPVSTNAVDLVPVQTTPNGFQRWDFVLIQNDAAARLYIRIGGVASTVDFSLYLDPGEAYEFRHDWIGARISGIWDVADAAGRARVTVGG
jgi:hypothetical protein